MSDFMLPNEDETALKDFMTSGLTTGPKISTAALMAMARIKRRRARTIVASLAAVLLLCLYATSPLVLPALARAISAVPGVGPSFEQALKIHSLDLAYESGLLAALDKSVERDGVTLTVHTAYRDAHTFNILLSIRGEKDFVKTLANSIGPHVVLSSGRWKLGGFYTNRVYDDEENILYVALSSFEPLPWYVRKLSVSVAWLVNEADIEKYRHGIGWELVETSDPLTVSFALQRITDEQTQLIPINQTIVSEGTTVKIESLLLSPVRTILKYTYTGLEPSLGLVDEDGGEIRAFTMGSELGVGHVTCEATTSKEITVRFRGYSVHYEVEVPLEEGYEHTDEPSFRIESITPTQKLLPWISSSGDDFYADTKVVLRWDRGKWGSVSASGGHEEIGDGMTTIYLIRKNLTPDQLIQLTFGRWEGETQEITITR